MATISLFAISLGYGQRRGADHVRAGPGRDR